MVLLVRGVWHLSPGLFLPTDTSCRRPITDSTTQEIMSTKPCLHMGDVIGDLLGIFSDFFYEINGTSFLFLF